MSFTNSEKLSAIIFSNIACALLSFSFFFWDYNYTYIRVLPMSNISLRFFLVFFMFFTLWFFVFIYSSIHLNSLKLYLNHHDINPLSNCLVCLVLFLEPSFCTLLVFLIPCQFCFHALNIWIIKDTYLMFSLLFFCIFYYIIFFGS